MSMVVTLQINSYIVRRIRVSLRKSAAMLAGLTLSVQCNQGKTVNSHKVASDPQDLFPDQSQCTGGAGGQGTG